MGTGSQRKRKRSGFAVSTAWTTPGASTYAGPPVTQAPMRDQADQAMLDVGLVDPSLEGNVAPRPVAVAPIEFGPGSAEGNRARNEGAAGISKYLTMQKWLENQHPQRPPTPEEQLSATFEKLYGDPSKDIRAAYGAQESAINKQYDQMLSRLGTEHGAAERGVRAEGAQLQTALKAIGADATAQLAASNRGIDKEYSKALQAVNSNYKPLSADLAAQGAGGAGLQAERAAGQANLNEAHTQDAALGARYQQMLSQEINNRQATGATVTTANVQDLTRILQQSRDNASTDRLQAVAKVEASLAGDLAQAKSQKASAKYSFFLSALKSGGTLGEAGAATLTPAQKLKAAQDYVKSGVVNWKSAFSGLEKSQDPEAVGLGQKFREQIQMSPHPLKAAIEAWGAWMAKGKDYRAKHPEVNSALMNALGLAQTATAARESAKLGMGG